MTRENRLKYLKGLLKCELCEETDVKTCKVCDNRPIGSSCICYDALKEEIEALEQQPCEDVVSRKKLLKIYEDRFLKLQKLKHLKDNKGVEDRQLGINYCINILKEMTPIIPQEPKTGHWIRVDKDKLKCSECDVIHFIAQYPQGKIAWCPNCGANMDSQESEEEDA